MNYALRAVSLGLCALTFPTGKPWQPMLAFGFGFAAVILTALGMWR